MTFSMKMFIADVRAEGNRQLTDFCLNFDNILNLYKLTVQYLTAQHAVQSFCTGGSTKKGRPVCALD